MRQPATPCVNQPPHASTSHPMRQPATPCVNQPPHASTSHHHASTSHPMRQPATIMRQPATPCVNQPPHASTSHPMRQPATQCVNQPRHVVDSLPSSSRSMTAGLQKHRRVGHWPDMRGWNTARLRVVDAVLGRASTALNQSATARHLGEERMQACTGGVAACAAAAPARRPRWRHPSSWLRARALAHGSTGTTSLHTIER
jgi:hypothetical protein